MLECVSIGAQPVSTNTAANERTETERKSITTEACGTCAAGIGVWFTDDPSAVPRVIPGVPDQRDRQSSARRPRRRDVYNHYLKPSA